MPRYAELPGGKRLSFDDKATDRDIQRAVRRELGLEHADLIDAVEKMADSIGDLSRRTDANSKALVAELGAKFADSLGKAERAVSDAGKNAAAASERLGKEFAKAVSRNSDLISDLAAAIGGLKTGIERVLEHSKSAGEQARKSADGTAAMMDKAAKRMEDAVKIFIRAVEVYEAARSTPKKVRRLQDGSYTIEVESRRLQS